ncbi:UDP-N-acetylmuramoyl-L-alanyl-D-glutamate--2,6-diaminopimelate ligase [Shewanella violacea]|uniref:UDP-N-acetylmuramyl-tripeptide synthetase n=2 Tax=Shewanella violacea TaxID=60217 RepID=D4ZDU8_SHEVD|nr:UDP-N-acetylmuramoyl-L-alanyl-D-glutamate--2,6-diaminopimelate ligase [Shewanella violacea]BAB19197.1 MurE [Shewanella violacea]BAJ04009.1 UDP-N-acetylmuramoylalanyl-D-glutamate--2,6-diaminopimelate ligase [Shewanella violacea DSS12]
MQLNDLLAPWLHYSGSESFNGMSLDSRAITVGDLFIAVPGHLVDGRKFIQAAFEQGAVAALVHTDEPTEHGQVLSEASASLQILFFQLNQELSAIGAQAYPLAPQRLKLIGVTGTNGKTSITQLMAQLVALQGKQASLMGTLGNGLWGDLVESGNTTADPITIAAQLQDFDLAGADLCAMEVSSHGLIQNRVAAVPFDVAVFTNLSRDHLDYHGTMQAYGDAKKRLFKFSSLQSSLINLDDEVGRQWLSEEQEAKHLGFSICSAHADAASIYTQDNHLHHQGVMAMLVWPEGRAKLASPLLGSFNLSNLVAALGALYLIGYDMQALVASVPLLTPVAGRMERFTTANGVTIVVDYAHSPDAIEQALKALRGHCEGQLWCLFGCGGDRDKGKRPLMAQAAETYADKVMITSDNVRSESPEAIIEDILVGLEAPERVLTQVNREQAIRQVVALAKPGDLVLLAGKGHETYQEVAGVRFEYDERALAKSLAGEQI